MPGWDLLRIPITEPLPTQQPVVLQAETPIASQALIGNGLVRPFRRERRIDWVSANDDRLLSSSIGQILGTQADGPNSSGELPWRTQFGSLLNSLRHKNNNAGLRAEARMHVVQALNRWEPRIVLRRLEVKTTNTDSGKRNKLDITVKFGRADENSAVNQVSTANVQV